MKFDGTDLKIFNKFVESETLTSTDIAKKLFKPKNREELVAKNSLVDYRLKKWLKFGLIIKKSVNGVNHYSLNNEVITYGDSYLSINGVKVDTGLAMIIDLSNNGYIIKFLEED